MTRSVAKRLQEFRNGWVFRTNTNVGTGHPHLGQAGADRVLAGDKRGPAGRTALLTVIVSEGHTFIADTIDVRRAVPHLAAIVVADVPPADVISPKDEDVRLARLSRHLDLPCLIRRAGASDEAVSKTRRLHLTQQYSKESEQADENKEGGDGHHRRMHLLSAYARPHPGDLLEWLRPHVTNCPSVFPNRHQKRQHAAGNERKAEILRRSAATERLNKANADAEAARVRSPPK